MNFVRNISHKALQQIPFNYSLKLAPRFYSNEVKTHFETPKNVGSLNMEEADVGTALVGKAACGDVIKFQVKINPTTRIVEDAKFRTFGCGAVIASSSYVSDLIKGQTVEEALKLKNSDVADALSLPPVKIHCSLLAEDAIKRAVANWQAKQESW